MQRVLIVEDDVMIADCIEDFLVGAGFEVCGITGHVTEAIRLAQECKPDLAVIDLRLRDGQFGTEIAAALCPGGTIGVLYASGNPDHPMLRNAAGEGCIAKPYTQATLVSALGIVSEIMAKVEPLSPFPLNFRRLNA